MGNGTGLIVILVVLLLLIVAAIVLFVKIKKMDKEGEKWENDTHDWN